jgi:hypothetical protein
MISVLVFPRDRSSSGSISILCDQRDLKKRADLKMKEKQATIVTATSADPGFLIEIWFKMMSFSKHEQEYASHEKCAFP